MTDRSNSVKAPRRIAAGFTLIEVMIAVAIAAILAAVAIPNYVNYVVRSSRTAAQGELLDVAAAQERIFLNSGAYTNNVSAAYTGLAAGGLGITSGRTKDARYTLTVTLAGANFYTATATPVANTTQTGDGAMTLTSAGTRLWRGNPW